VPHCVCVRVCVCVCVCACVCAQGSSGTMQLMETEFSKTLGEMVDLHLHHQKSIPAFLSSLTLDLFSRQTIF